MADTGAARARIVVRTRKVACIVRWPRKSSFNLKNLKRENVAYKFHLSKMSARFILSAPGVTACEGIPQTICLDSNNKKEFVFGRLKKGIEVRI